MSKEHDVHAGVMLMAFVMGAITGAATALLMAPSAGPETRRVLQSKAREGKKKATLAAEQSREFMQDQRENVSKAINRGREAYKRAKKGLETKAEGQV